MPVMPDAAVFTTRCTYIWRRREVSVSITLAGFFQSSGLGLW
jgi:hypothetical protein